MTWTKIDPETEDPDIFVQRYDASGNAISEIIRVNTTTADAQFMSQILGFVGCQDSFQPP